MGTRGQRGSASKESMEVEPTNYNKETSNFKCQLIYMNLLKMISATTGEASASTYIREFAQTGRCNDFCNLWEVQTAVKTFLGIASLNRLMQREETEKDERAAADALVHYNLWAQKELQQCLSWRQWTYFNFIYKPSQGLEAVGLVGASYQGLRLVNKSLASARRRHGNQK